MDLSNENVIHIKKNGVEYLQFKRLLEYSNNLTHAFTVGIENDYRMPLYYSTNSVLSKEQIELNRKSYRNLCESTGIRYENIVKTHQIHKDIIKNVDYKINKNEPDFYEERYSETDGLLTNKKQIALCATNADCIVFMFYDPNKNVIANVHSGWRGTVKKIAVKTIEKMQEKYNCNPRDIICCISPSIRECHFEVDDDVKDIFLNNFSKYPDIIKSNGKKWHIDTVGLNIQMLKEKGLKDENIIDSKICTMCKSNSIHSYRGSNHTNGLEIGLIELK